MRIVISAVEDDAIALAKKEEQPRGLHVLKDSHHHIIGYIETRSDGTQVGRDAHRRIMGYFEPRTNQTKDAHFKLVGFGNLLACQIVCP